MASDCTNVLDDLGARQADGEMIDRLAAMDDVAYDRARIDAARAMGIRATALDRVVARRRAETRSAESIGLDLDDPEPWPAPVDGAKLIDDLTGVIDRHVGMSGAAVAATAMWVMHAHAHDTSDISPILGITSPTHACGKTTVLTLLGAVVPRPVAASNITAAALFRAVERWSPTLLVDEADTYLRNSDDLRGVLNSGHARRTAYVIRTVGDDHEPMQLRTWAPKAIACIGRLPATIASRSIHLELRRLAPGESVAPLRGDRVDHLELLQRQAWRWAQDHAEEIRAHDDPDMPERLRGRAADNWRHLVSIADIVGGQWPTRVRHAAERMAGDDDAQSAGIMLLADLREIMSGRDRMATTDILAQLHEMDHRPWPEWSRGRPMTARALGRVLGDHGVRSVQWRNGEDRQRGYIADDLADVWARYLPGHDPSIRDKPFPERVSADTNPCQASAHVTEVNVRKPAPSAECHGYSDREGEPWGGEV